jgi:hypothetical protein
MSDRTLTERIQDDDPMFLPLHRAISRLTVDDVPGYRAARAERVLSPDGSRPLPMLDYVNAAWSRVSNDGYHGPLRDDDWAEQDGRRPYDVATSLDVLAVVSDAIEPYHDSVYPPTPRWVCVEEARVTGSRARAPTRDNAVGSASRN